MIGGKIWQISCVVELNTWEFKLPNEAWSIQEFDLVCVCVGVRLTVEVMAPQPCTHHADRILHKIPNLSEVIL